MAQGIVNKLAPHSVLFMLSKYEVATCNDELDRSGITEGKGKYADPCHIPTTRWRGLVSD